MGLITTPASITLLAEKLTTDLRSGLASRASLSGSQAAAFAWTDGLPPSIANYVTTVSVPGMRFDTVVASPSATPAGKVAEGAPKPNSVAFTTTTTPLAKYAGYGTWSLEADLSAEALAAAIYQVITGQSLMALETDVLAAIADGATIAATGASWAEALLSAQAQVLANGGRPGVISVSAADYAALMLENAGAGGFAMFNDPAAGPLGQLLFGSAVHVSPTQIAGTAYVFDPTAVLIGENEASPIVIADPFSQSVNNKIQLVVDLIAAGVVVGPGAVASATPAAA